MDHGLLRSYFSTIYELPGPHGLVRVSLDGEIASDTSKFPEPLTQKFALLTAYNPRSMLLPRRVNEQRNQVMRDLLVLGCYRVEACVGYEEEPEGVWREPAWLVQGIDRTETVSFGRVFRQNVVVYCEAGTPNLIVTDVTLDDIGKTYPGNWHLRS
ncbi:MAG TPA: DUF3293 domain-containing protein [Polyangiaceae bacterium]|nr:DUF3293 domain-containing protein [Polyangiaceae bacterium]